MKLTHNLSSTQTPPLTNRLTKEILDVRTASLSAPTLAIASQITRVDKLKKKKKKRLPFTQANFRQTKPDNICAIMRIRLLHGFLKFLCVRAKVKVRTSDTDFQCRKTFPLLTNVTQSHPF